MSGKDEVYTTMKEVEAAADRLFGTPGEHRQLQDAQAKRMADARARSIVREGTSVRLDYELFKRLTEEFEKEEDGCTARAKFIAAWSIRLGGAIWNVVLPAWVGEKTKENCEKAQKSLAHSDKLAREHLGWLFSGEELVRYTERYEKNDAVPPACICRQHPEMPQGIRFRNPRAS